MRTGHRPAWRRRPQSRAARIAVPLAIPMALGLTLGSRPRVYRRAVEHDHPAVGRGRDRQPERERQRRRGGQRRGEPGGHGARHAAARAAAAANVSCDIVVPANPLTAQGLATPYQLTGPNGMTPAASGCTMANFANLGAFVQATILDPATGALSVYEPLVVTKGTRARRGPGRAHASRGRGRHHRLRVQRHQPDPGRRQRPRASGRATASTA